jgi:hypothetical protein
MTVVKMKPAGVRCISKWQMQNLKNKFELRDDKHVTYFLYWFGRHPLALQHHSLAPCSISYDRVCAHVLPSPPLLIAYLYSSRILGSFRDCKLETPLRKRRSRVSITNEFSVKRQRVSEAIGSIDVSTDVEQRQEYANTNAEPRVRLCLSRFRV